MSKIVIITGVSRGLGFVLAQKFASSGWKVIGTGRSIKPDNLPQGVAYHQFDASDATACESFWQQIHTEHAEEEICLVNNAGGYVNGSLTETKAEDYALQMQSSYFSAVYMTRSLALHFLKARIINIISSSALVARKNDSAYGAAKAATRHFFHSLQEEYKSEQYQITNIYPSDIATHGADPQAIDPEDLAIFVWQQAENESSYYLRDATINPR